MPDMKPRSKRHNWKKECELLRSRIQWHEHERSRMQTAVEEATKLVDKGWARAHFYSARLKEVISQGVEEMWDNFVREGKTHATPSREVPGDDIVQHPGDDQERAPSGSRKSRRVSKSRKGPHRRKTSLKTPPPA